jgi:hypothetical protein
MPKDEKNTSGDKETLINQSLKDKDFCFPEHNITIKAKTKKEAREKLEKILKK